LNQKIASLNDFLISQKTLYITGDKIERKNMLMQWKSQRLRIQLTKEEKSDKEAKMTTGVTLIKRKICPSLLLLCILLVPGNNNNNDDRVFPL